MDRLSGLDASFLYLEQPNSLLHVAGIYSFAKPLDYKALVKDVGARLPPTAGSIRISSGASLR